MGFGERGEMCDCWTVDGFGTFFSSPPSLLTLSSLCLSPPLIVSLDSMISTSEFELTNVINSLVISQRILTS